MPQAKQVRTVIKPHNLDYLAELSQQTGIENSTELVNFVLKSLQLQGYSLAKSDRASYRNVTVTEPQSVIDLGAENPKSPTKIETILVEQSESDVAYAAIKAMLDEALSTGYSYVGESTLAYFQEIEKVATEQGLEVLTWDTASDTKGFEIREKLDPTIARLSQLVESF